MTDDLIERLRAPRKVFGDIRPTPRNPDGPEAADRIEALSSECEGLREALEFYRNEWEQDVDAERTATGWEGSIGEAEPTEALFRDRGERARTALSLRTEKATEHEG